MGHFRAFVPPTKTPQRLWNFLSPGKWKWFIPNFEPLAPILHYSQQSLKLRRNCTSSLLKITGSSCTWLLAAPWTHQTHILLFPKNSFPDLLQVSQMSPLREGLPWPLYLKLHSHHKALTPPLHPLYLSLNFFLRYCHLLGYHILYLFTKFFCLLFLGCKLHKSRDLYKFCSLMYPHHLEKCLNTSYGFSDFAEWIHEGTNRLPRPKEKVQTPFYSHLPNAFSLYSLSHRRTVSGKCPSSSCLRTPLYSHPLQVYLLRLWLSHRQNFLSPLYSQQSLNLCNNTEHLFWAILLHETVFPPLNQLPR